MAITQMMMRAIFLLGLCGLALGRSIEVADSDVETTTYDWGQHTGSTFDWGKYTSTHKPGQERTTYDWGQHTGSTYDWGKHTSTQGPDDHTDDNNNHDQDQNHNYRCGAGKYSCAGTVGMCIDIHQICDSKPDCPHGDDEKADVCHFQQRPSLGIKYRNQFAGTGFQYHIRNVKIAGGSQVKLFEQDSNNQNS